MYFIHAIISKILANPPGDPWLLVHVKVIESDLPEILQNAAPSNEVWDSSHSLASATFIVNDAEQDAASSQSLKLAFHWLCVCERRYVYTFQ